MTAHDNAYVSVPFSGTVLTLSEISAPVAVGIINAVAFAFGALGKMFAHGNRAARHLPAPHASVILVPGEFVTGPFAGR